MESELSVTEDSYNRVDFQLNWQSRRSSEGGTPEDRCFARSSADGRRRGRGGLRSQPSHTHTPNFLFVFFLLPPSLRPPGPDSPHPSGLPPFGPPPPSLRAPNFSGLGPGSAHLRPFQGPPTEGRGPFKAQDPSMPRAAGQGHPPLQVRGPPSRGPYRAGAGGRGGSRRGTSLSTLPP